MGHPSFSFFFFELGGIGISKVKSSHSQCFHHSLKHHFENKQKKLQMQRGKRENESKRGLTQEDASMNVSCVTFSSHSPKTCYLG